MRRDNRRLEAERDLLKRAAAFFAKETETMGDLHATLAPVRASQQRFEKVLATANRPGVARLVGR